jgi:hypothetical protein
MFRKLDLFSSSGEGRERPNLFSSTETANLNHWAIHIILTIAI